MSNLFDSANAPIGEPDELVVGDRVQWKRTDLSDYDNTLFTLEYRARKSGQGSTEIEITAAADGVKDFLVTETSAVTAEWEKGTYYWQAYMLRVSDGERVSIDRGMFEIKANFDDDEGDPRSHARIMLDKIRSILENRADNDVDNYAIAGRSITKMSVDELMKWESHYRNRVQAEVDEIARGKGEPTGNTIQMRFTR